MMPKRKVRLPLTGDRVLYHPIIGGPDDGKVYIVREIGELPRTRGRFQPVAWLEGKAGCVAVEALTILPPGETKDA